MPPTRKPRPLGRYSLRKVILELEEQFERRGRGSKTALALDLGFRPPEITRRQDDDEVHWNLEDLGRVADAWGAPTGWPFIPWDEAKEREDLWKGRARKKP
jgi:hypothetical protein